MIRWRALGVGLALTACSTPPIEPPPIEEREAFAWADDREGLVAQCEGCHQAQAAEWRDSLHRDSFANAAFQTSYHRTPFAFCRNCHAPQHAVTERAEPPDAWAAANGVTCLDCHPAEPDELRAAAPHGELGTRDEHACGGCHQFEFPGPASAPAPAGLMQRTIWEHARSEYADVSCTECHMPEVGPDHHRDHTFAVSRDPSLLRASLSAEATRIAPDRVRFALAPVGVGHAFPTGDLFRRIEIRAIARSAAGEITATDRRYLARHFPPPRRGHPPSIELEPDDRLTGPTELDLLLPNATEADVIEWEVSYQRVDHRDALHPERSTLHGETVLASGKF